MKKIKNLIIVGILALVLGLTNVNASSYIGTKKYDFKEFDITNVEDGFYGFYEYKGDLFVIGNDDKSYKITSGDKLKLEVAEKTYVEHLYELYPKTVLTGIEYSGIHEDLHDIGTYAEYINGEPFGAGSQPIQGIPTDYELTQFGILNNKVYLCDTMDIESNKFDTNIYIVDASTLTLLETIKVTDVAKIAGMDTPNTNVTFMPLVIDEVSDPYYMVMTFTVEEQNIIPGKDIVILDNNLNKIVSFNTGNNVIDYILPIKGGSKFLIEMYNTEKDVFETKLMTKDGAMTDFITPEEGQDIHVYTHNGFVISYDFTNENSIYTIYDEDLNKIKTYNGEISIFKLVNEESDIRTNIEYVDFSNFDLFGKETQSSVNNDKYLIYSYEYVEECPEGEEYGCNYSEKVKTIELLTVEDKKTVNVTGILKDKDGNPLKDYTVELHSTVRTVTTNQNGYFKFDNVEEGKHTLTIKDANGTTLATKEINVIYGTETKLDGDTLYFNEADNGVNINLKLDGTNLSIASIDKGVSVPKTFDTLTNSIIVLITLTLSTLFIIKKTNKIKYIKN